MILHTVTSAYVSTLPASMMGNVEDHCCDDSNDCFVKDIS
jgi:hypothetical protein